MKYLDKYLMIIIQNNKNRDLERIYNHFLLTWVFIFTVLGCSDL